MGSILHMTTGTTATRTVRPGFKNMTSYMRWPENYTVEDVRPIMRRIYTQLRIRVRRAINIVAHRNLARRNEVLYAPGGAGAVAAKRSFSNQLRNVRAAKRSRR
jgi:hypothetical protein